MGHSRYRREWPRPAACTGEGSNASRDRVVAPFTLAVRALFRAREDAECRRPARRQLVAELTELLQQAEIAICDLRHRCAGRRADRAAAVDSSRRAPTCASSRTTLLRIAATNADAEVFAELADGPTALVVGFDEPVGAARGIAKYIDDTPGTPMEIRNAVVSGELVDAGIRPGSGHRAAA